jgi:hypothetical protein
MTLILRTMKKHMGWDDAKRLCRLGWRKVCRSHAQGHDIANVDLVREHIALSCPSSQQRTCQVTGRAEAAIQTTIRRNEGAGSEALRISRPCRSPPYRHQPFRRNLELQGALLHRGNLVRRLYDVQPDGLAGELVYVPDDRPRRFGHGPLGHAHSIGREVRSFNRAERPPAEASYWKRFAKNIPTK